jgi:flagellar biogenesis protein FliO
MELFAHNGSDHSSELEATTHSAGSTVLTVLLISVAVIGLITITIYLLKRFSLIKVASKDKEKE